MIVDSSQEAFYQMVTRLRSRAAAQSQDDVRITEMINGVLVTRPAKKYQEITEEKPIVTTTEARVWNLDKDGLVLQSKAASVPVNKMKAINDFINRGR